MAQVLPEVYDFRQHDRLWRRVQPGLEHPEEIKRRHPTRV